MADSRKSYLKVEPSNELEFYGPFTAVQTSTIKLVNPSEDRITFKVKTTAPKRYCVRPSCGIVEPLETITVAVMLQPFDCDGAEKNKHKFMIQSMILGSDAHGNLEQVWKEANSSQVGDVILKCTLRMPDDLLKCEPEELVFEGPISESSKCFIIARNTCPRDVVFKVKTNAPRRYEVTPNEDIIKARETKEIKVATVPGVESSGESRDRLALLSVLAPDEMPVNISQVWQSVDKTRISEKFFTCTFLNQEKQQTPRSSPVNNQLNQLTQEIEKLRKENEELRAMATSSGPVEALRFNIPPILYLLITFLFALAVGKFML